MAGFGNHQGGRAESAVEEAPKLVVENAKNNCKNRLTKTSTCLLSHFIILQIKDLSLPIFKQYQKVFTRLCHIFLDVLKLSTRGAWPNCMAPRTSKSSKPPSTWGRSTVRFVEAMTGTDQLLEPIFLFFFFYHGHIWSCFFFVSKL